MTGIKYILSCFILQSVSAADFILVLYPLLPCSLTISDTRQPLDCYFLEKAGYIWTWGLTKSVSEVILASIPCDMRLHGSTALSRQPTLFHRNLSVIGGTDQKWITSGPSHSSYNLDFAFNSLPILFVKNECEHIIWRYEPWSHSGLNLLYTITPPSVSYHNLHILSIDCSLAGQWLLSCFAEAI